MRLFYHALILMLILTLCAQVALLELRIEDAYDKAEDAAFIAAMFLDEEPPEIVPFMHKRYTVPKTSEEHPWLLENPVPEFIPPPEIF